MMLQSTQKTQKNLELIREFSRFAVLKKKPTKNNCIYMQQQSIGNVKQL